MWPPRRRSLLLSVSLASSLAASVALVPIRAPSKRAVSVRAADRDDLLSELARLEERMAAVESYVDANGESRVRVPADLRDDLLRLLEDKEVSKLVVEEPSPNPAPKPRGRRPKAVVYLFKGLILSEFLSSTLHELEDSVRRLCEAILDEAGRGTPVDQLCEALRAEFHAAYELAVPDGAPESRPAMYHRGRPLVVSRNVLDLLPKLVRVCYWLYTGWRDDALEQQMAVEFACERLRSPPPDAENLRMLNFAVDAARDGVFPAGAAWEYRVRYPDWKPHIYGELASKMESIRVQEAELVEPILQTMHWRADVLIMAAVHACHQRRHARLASRRR
eukprot:scaffold1272_cov250-Pinguiococcus_pyrenoidosus.AAC.59